ncbi:hypothetical protein D3C83_50910 [compost metagenome]
MHPRQDALSFGREPVKPLAPLDDRHAELLFELPYPARERRLRDAALLRRPGEVLLARESGHVLKLAYVHVDPGYTETQFAREYQSAVTMIR